MQKTIRSIIVIVYVMLFIPAITTGQAYAQTAEYQPHPPQGYPLGRILVKDAGFQHLTQGAIATMLGTYTYDSTTLRLDYRGQEVAMQDLGNGEMQFYAPVVGDRWNTSETYWLSIQSGPRKRTFWRLTMPTTPSRATQTEVTQTGTWRDPSIYDPTTPGPSGDHWFSADMKTGGSLPAAYLTVPTPADLPLISGTTTITVTGYAYTNNTHILQANINGTLSQPYTWNGVGIFVIPLTVAATAPHAVLTFVSPDSINGIEIDTVTWSRNTTTLATTATKPWITRTGDWKYTVVSTGEIYQLYDISGPDPIAVATIRNVFEQQSSIAKTYIFQTSANTFTPTISAAQVPNLTSSKNAQAIYIRPDSFASALQPLIDLRRSQGYTVFSVSPQAIYDTWSYGQTSPEAIRKFLQYSMANWSTKPLGVVLIGDGTSDPHNYLNKDNATQIIPPYMAMVDPNIGETACETCYGQLDGLSPLEDPLPDLWIGRLPVQSAEKLASLVAKITGYEQTQQPILSKSTQVYLADNYTELDGSTDTAGDFPSIADNLATSLPNTFTVQRLYYDPTATSATPWREANATSAHNRTMQLLNNSPGMVTYFGHSHQFQLAVTDPTNNPSYLLGLYDSDNLTNAKPFIMRQMSCLTSSFQTPSNSGTTIDERLILAKNGAIAVWGSSGEGVTRAHTMLITGFDQKLAESKSGTVTIGAAIQAAYRKIGQSGINLDAIQTYILLGDPFTRPQIEGAQFRYLPITQR